MPTQIKRMVPVAIAATVIVLISLTRTIPILFPVADHPGESRFDLIQRLEGITYDWRMRLAFRHAAPAATNLAAVFIDDEGLQAINQKLNFYWPWPRQLFGRVIRELAAQGAEIIGCDVFFLERQTDFTETRVNLPGGQQISSDLFFARTLRAANRVVLGSPGEISHGQWRLLPPDRLFLTNALGLGYASTDPDADGVLRRARPFRDDPELGRVWHLGLRVAAAHLQLDLEHPEIEPGRLTLRGPRGLSRTIPLDRDGFFLIDWSLGWFDKRLAYATFEELLEFDGFRQAGETNLEPAMADKLVFIGSIGSGRNISDVGATPLEKETYLVSKHWNVANSLLTGRFIRPPKLGEELALITLLGAIAAWLTWRLRVLVASACVLIVLAGYVALGAWLFLRYRYWLPLFLPALGALFMTHVSLVTWRVVFEQSERRRVRGVFSKIVAPEVVNELLRREQLALGGTLRTITVLFADVRGFTRLTDDNQREVEQRLRELQLTGPAAEALLAENARETLDTVNRYLAVIADNIKLYRGTLDKYIGDCVMAFWGAPVPSPRHAADAVRAAIESQRAMHALNQQREEENRRILAENVERLEKGLPPRRLLGVLSLGTGINTGTATVGLMGSDQHILNYTVFGREVNLASRLEGVSGHGRIIISQSTYDELKHEDPALAAICRPLPAVTVKGISEAVAIYEVPWQPATDPTNSARGQPG